MLMNMEPANAPNPPTTEPLPTRQPGMDVLPPRPSDAPKVPPMEAAASATAGSAVKLPKQIVTKQPKQTHSGVTLAVVATIIIVITLGAFFVYAYLRTQNISIL